MQKKLASKCKQNCFLGTNETPVNYLLQKTWPTDAQKRQRSDHLVSSFFDDLVEENETLHDCRTGLWKTDSQSLLICCDNLHLDWNVLNSFHLKIFFNSYKAGGGWSKLALPPVQGPASCGTQQHPCHLESIYKCILVTVHGASTWYFLSWYN